MRSHALTVGTLGAVALGGAIWSAHGALGAMQAGQQSRSAVNARSALTIDGPYTHDNLAIYVVRGASDDSRAYLTLDQGLAAGTVDVREKGAATGQDQAAVNSLEIENKSERWVFLHAGDIVKGGKQDRTIMTDMLLPPHSKPQPIDAFCVEHGRWTPSRDGLAFKANPGIVAGTALKRAIQSEKSQQRVWQEVATAEGRAVTVARASAVAEPQLAVTSPSPRLSSTGTYNAIAENKSVSSSRSAYVAALLPSIRKHKDAIGLAVAINGRMSAADVYTSSSLFAALSGKLVDSYALEALLARDAAQGSKPPAKEHVTAFLASASSAPATGETIGQSMHRSTRETPDAVMYEYAHLAKPAARDGLVVHKSYLKK